MARGLVDDLSVRHPIGRALPSLYHDDEFAQRFCEGLDAVAAPTPATLDSFWAYLDADLAPEDFLEWLGGWVGVAADPTWPLARRRALVQHAVDLYRRRGTRQGLADLVELYTGVRPELVEGGGTAWATTPEGPMPGTGSDEVVVRLRVADASAIDVAQVDRMVAAAKPAHLRHRVEVAGLDVKKPLPPPGKSPT